jgi:hypothetical protein
MERSGVRPFDTGCYEVYVRLYPLFARQGVCWSTTLTGAIAMHGSDYGTSVSLAAGGRARKADVWHSFEAGADATILCARFVAAVETDARRVCRQAPVTARPSGTADTYCFDGGWPFGPRGGASLKGFRDDALYCPAACLPPPILFSTSRRARERGRLRFFEIER